MTQPRPSVPRLSRRAFLKTAALAGGGMTLGACALPNARKARMRAAADRLNIAFIGASGRAHGNIEGILPLGENIVAMCDVDRGRAEAGAKQVAGKHPNVRLYADYRRLLEEEKDLDAVVVSTPDHMHAPITMMALDMGLHVYCEKPLTRTVWEARQVRERVLRHGAVTQMGNQGSAGDGLRRSIEILRAGAIGHVREAHIWTNRPIWPQGLARPEGSDPVPEGLDWDTWLGVAPVRPFKNDVYLPFKWRGWHDFGTGAVGDIACHTCNMTYQALHLADPVEVEAEVSDTMPETFPASSHVRMQFPAREGLPPVTLHWYDGGRMPGGEIREDIVRNRGEMPEGGEYLVGDKGVLFGGFVRMKDETKFKGLDHHEACKAVPQTLPRVAGAHHKEWIDGIKGGPAPFSNFDIASRLTASMLLGAIAQRLGGRKLQWDAVRAQFVGAPDANALLKPTYRPGWTV